MQNHNFPWRPNSVIEREMTRTELHTNACCCELTRGTSLAEDVPETCRDLPRSSSLSFVCSVARASNAAGLTLEWDPPSDGVTTGFVLFYGTASQSYSQQVNVGGATSYTVNGLSAGTTYYFAVRAYDASGMMSDPSSEVQATIAPNVTLVVTALALSANVPSPQVAGSTITWLSTAAGGIAPYQFQWMLYQAGSWTIGPWTLSPTWTWTPSTPGNDYQVRVAVRSAGSSNPSGELSQTMPFAVTLSSTTLSPDGTLVPGAPQIVDRQGAVWTIGANRAILRNGTQAAGGLGTKILWTGGTIYVFGVDNGWWQWLGAGWAAIGPTQPGGSVTPLPTPTSPNGTLVPGASQIVDSQGAVWTIGANQAILRNGTLAAGG